MKVAAVIAEYNPFHNGHLYHLNQTRRLTGADYVLVVMSGDFVQRGAPALCDKYLRTRMALLGGADAVIELPVLYALSSAEYFAQGAVSLLENLGVVSCLSFGSESGEITPFLSLGKALCSPDVSYEKNLAAHLKEGMCFPQARQKTLTELLSAFPELASEKADSCGQTAADFLSCPNNILGLEYCKALYACKSSILPVTFKRLGQYHQDRLKTAPPDAGSGYSSASAIRKALDSQRKRSLIQKHIPGEMHRLFESEGLYQRQVKKEDFSGLVQYRLLQQNAAGFETFLDSSRDLSCKIQKNLSAYTDMETFIRLLKSKDITYTRLSRLLFHILLNIQTPDFYVPPIYKRILPAPYARLLGFRSTATPLLSAIHQNASIPLITKLSRWENLLMPEDSLLLKQDLFAAAVYETVAGPKFGRPSKNEYRQSPVLL